MTDIMEMFGAFGVRVWEKGAETPLTRVPVKHPDKGAPPQPPPAPLVLDAAGHKFAQTADARDQATEENSVVVNPETPPGGF